MFVVCGFKGQLDAYYKLPCLSNANKNLQYTFWCETDLITDIITLFGSMSTIKGFHRDYFEISI